MKATATGRRDAVPPTVSPGTHVVSWAAIVMTQHYVAGELSLRLAQLQALAADPSSADDAARLRHEAETYPLTALTSIVTRAMHLTDTQCWDSVTRGDITAFARQSALSAELYEFSVCAGLIEES